MKVYIKVKEAIAYHNRRNKGNKMTLISLGKQVFKDDDRIISENTMKQYLSGWNNGYTNSKIPSLYYVIKISIATGFSLDDLVHYED